MYYIRLVTAFAAMLLSLLCFEEADIKALTPNQTNTAVSAVETAEALYEQISQEVVAAVTEAISEDTCYMPLSGRTVEMMPLRLPRSEEKPETGMDTSVSADDAREADEYYIYDENAVTFNRRYRSDLAMEQVIAAHEEQAEQRRMEEARRKAEEEQRRRREAIEAEQRRIAAKEAALKAACPGYDAKFVATLTKEEQAEARYFYEQGFVYYRQNWSVLDQKEYGNEGFGLCGCGPTCIAAIISNLAGVPVDPEEMRVYGLSVGSWLASGGTTYGFLIETAKKYGIKTTQIYASDKEALFEALRDENKLVLATMGPGDFTLGAHFMLFRGITDEGKILISDSYSFEFSKMEWEYDYLYAQLKTGYWIFEKEN